MMSRQLTTTKRHQIVVSPQNYEALRKFGKVNPTFNEALTEALRLAELGRKQGDK